jgi:hypothetical protein
VSDVVKTETTKKSRKNNVIKIHINFINLIYSFGVFKYSKGAIKSSLGRGIWEDDTSVH